MNPENGSGGGGGAYWAWAMPIAAEIAIQVNSVYVVLRGVLLFMLSF
jgi:hypothetical protein